MTIISDAAALCAATYHPDPSFTWDAQGDTGAVWWGIKESPTGVQQIAMRGSVLKDGNGFTPDWFRDFLAIPIHPLFNHPQLGWIHAGFWLGMEEAYAAIKAYFENVPIVDPLITGHSLGAAHATILAGLFAIDRPSLEMTRIVFGEPNEAIGRKGLNGIVEKRAVNYSFRNQACQRIDPVTIAPAPPYDCPTSHIRVVVPGLTSVGLDLGELHHMPNYVASVASYVG